jgi:hypothetical protein
VQYRPHRLMTDVPQYWRIGQISSGFGLSAVHLAQNLTHLFSKQSGSVAVTTIYRYLTSNAH